MRKRVSTCPHCGAPIYEVYDEQSTAPQRELEYMCQCRLLMQRSPEYVPYPAYPTWPYQSPWYGDVRITFTTDSAAMVLS